MEPDDKQYLLKLADILNNAERVGAEVDNPEGARNIVISSTLADMIADRLRSIAEK